MNSQNSKHEAIKTAYGDMWIYMSSFPQARKIALENEGWVFITQLPSTIDRTLFDFQHGDSICRPKSLSGIENNRGWTRIESEEDLPDKYGQYWVFTSNGNIIDVYYDEHDKTWDGILDFFEVKATHWQQIVKPKSPIF
ncbi:hypothetical protein CMU71_14745 [Elizabethkingia anophelis]|nr:hypothetical protein [Elizabethkingia anophelis]